MKQISGSAARRYIERKRDQRARAMASMAKPKWTDPNPQTRHTGVYAFGLPALSSAPKGAYPINREHATRFAIELAYRGVYLGMYDPER